MTSADYCSPHNDPADWVYSPDRYGRPGFHTVNCRRCGGFIGYQPPRDQPREELLEPDAELETLFDEVEP